MVVRSLTSRRAGWLASSLLTSLVALPAPLLAQTGQADPAAASAEAANAGVASDEIIVTAQKREQNLQQVPISVAVLDTRKLDQLQVQRFEDYVKYLPSVAISGSNPGGNATIVIRGIATDGGNDLRGSLPTVGVYLDEQPITSISGPVDLHVYDLARVEVLSGPQGTLFGASSEAGTIRLISNKPDFTKFAAGYDLELNKFTAGGVGGVAEAFVNVPFSDRAALRVTGFYDRDAGYIRNLLSSRTYPSSGITVTNEAVARDDYNVVKTYGGRAQLAVQLDDDWTITPSIVAQQQNRRGSFSEFPARGPNGRLVTQRYSPEYNRDRFFQAGLTITGKLADLDLTYAGAYFDRKGNGANDYADYAFFYDTLYGSGVNFTDNAGRLIDPTQLFFATGKSKKTSHEFRVATPTDKMLHGILGVFYQRQEEDTKLDYFVPNLATSKSVTGNPGTYYLVLAERIDRDFAVFGQADLDLSDRLTLTGGVRYYRYNNTYQEFGGTRGTEASCIGPALSRGQPCVTRAVKNADGTISPVQVKDDGFTYRGNATFKFDRNHLVYATVSDGFRPGGTNSRSISDPSASVVYGAEKLTNYEIGTKNTFADGQVTLNLTGFWQELRDIQLAVETLNCFGTPQVCTPGVFTTQNVGKARSRGFELDLRVRPIEGLTISNATTFTDATLREDYNNGFGLVAAKGQRLPFTSRWKTNLIARYEFPVGQYKAHIQAAEVYQSNAWNNFEIRNRAIFGKRGGYGVTDVTAGLAFGNSTFEFYASNLFDARGVTAKFRGCGVSICNPNQYVTYNQPRLIGVRFGQRF